MRITQRRSANGSTPRQRDTLRSLGLRGIGKSVERPDSPQVRGMVATVGHLVDVSEAAEAAEAAKSAETGSRAGG